METEQISQAILHYIREHYPSRILEEDGLDAETLLFQEGIVDSIGVLMLVQFLEEQFAIRLEAEEMVLDHFASVSRMAQLVQEKLQST